MIRAPRRLPPEEPTPPPRGEEPEVVPAPATKSRGWQIALTLWLIAFLTLVLYELLGFVWRVVWALF